jgi:hypothetical protein
VNSQEKALGKIEIKLPADWKAKSVKEFYSNQNITFSNDAISDSFYGSYGVKVYEIASR